MKVTINGREINERFTELEQREQHYFVIVKQVVVIIVGAIVFVGLPALFPIDLGVIADTAFSYFN